MQNGISKKSSERSAARSAAINKVKGAVKSAFGRAKQAGQSAVGKVRNAVDSRTRRYAERRGVVSSKSGKSALTTGTGINSVAYKQRTPAGRREVRSAVVNDVKGRIRKKVAKAQVDAYGAARKAKQTVSDVADRTAQNARNAATRTGRNVKSGIKGAIAGAASKVASGASRLANRMSEDVDIYDVVIDHLISEGYAETHEAAEKIMVNMSEDWVNAIVESGRMTGANDHQVGFARIRAGESGGRGKKPMSDAEIKKEKGGKEFLDRIKATKSNPRYK
jgi:hypothetical protein